MAEQLMSSGRLKHHEAQLKKRSQKESSHGENDVRNSSEIASPKTEMGDLLYKGTRAPL